MAKKTFYYSKRKAIFVFAFTIIGMAFVLVGLFIANLSIFSYIGFGVVLVAAVMKYTMFRCPHCNGTAAVRSVGIRFKPFKCPSCKKRIDYK